MMLVSAAAYTGHACAGAATETSPAPARAAARAAMRAAPVITPPPSTSACPRENLFPSAANRGIPACQTGGPFSQAATSRDPSTASAIPISATTTSPHSPRPGNTRCPGFLRKNVTVSAAPTAPRSAPLSPATPDGTSTATSTAPAATAACSTAATPSSSLRESPAPNSASTTSPAPATSAGVTASGGSRQACEKCAASAEPRPISPSTPTRTGHPADASALATTNPSPPLFPGPHSTTAAQGAYRRMISAATAWPAAAISRSGGMPLSLSAAAICAHVSSSSIQNSRQEGGRFRKGRLPRISGQRAPPRPGVPHQAEPSYRPECARQDLNPQPSRYERPALTS